MLSKLVDAGLVRVQTGIESGSSKESKEIHNRSPGNRAIMKFAEFNKQLKLNVVYDIIVDNPHATEEMKIETAEFLLDLPRPYDVYFYSLNYFLELRSLARHWRTGCSTRTRSRGVRTSRGTSSACLWTGLARTRIASTWRCSASPPSPSCPSRLIRKFLDEREYWKQNVEPVYMLAKATNMAKMAYVAARYFKNGELTWFKIRQYGDLSQMISQ